MSELRKGRAVLLVLPLLALGACGGEAAEEIEPLDEPVAEAPETPAADMARVEITNPAEGATVPGDSIQVALAVYGVEVEPADNRRTEGRGHHHLFIDADVSAADAAIPPTSETVIHMGNGAEEFVIPMLAPGPHRVIAVFAYGDHTPMQTVAQDTVNFTVGAQ